ncbi:MAG TPA: hypothetical protein PLY36_13215 [Spirochaetota bacterium]|nr:hypothetical protein [Spirochaetota bacterium]
MDMVFNELSILPLAVDKTESYNRLFEFINTFKKASTYGFKRIRFDKQYNQIELSHGYTIEDFCGETTDKNLKSLLLGLRRYPFIDSDTDQEISYIQNQYYLEKNGYKEKCYGLAAAYLYSTSGIGFLSESFWEQVKFSLIVENCDTGNMTENDIFCLSMERHVNDPGFQSWLENLGDVILVTTDLLPDEKEIKLRDDHGKDILKTFAERLVLSPYIIKVINSLPFNKNDKKFIKRIYPDGKIELVLTNTDDGYGMVIQTTGRNLRETEEIAEILKEKYYN